MKEAGIFSSIQLPPSPPVRADFQRLQNCLKNTRLAKEKKLSIKLLKKLCNGEHLQ
jgi:hypothetical protein